MVGKDVIEWKTGQRVGRRMARWSLWSLRILPTGGFRLLSICQVPGISYDGGYADYVIVPTEAVASIPDELSATEAAPLMCAGITTYNALRNSGAREGDAVAIVGVGGLGHLGIQFASKMGFKTIAIGRGKDKEEIL